jgi:hypothetical protein
VSAFFQIRKKVHWSDVSTTIENPRRLHHTFEIRDDEPDELLAEGFVRVGCAVDLPWT